MAKGEPLLRDVGHHDQYQVVDPNLSLPKVAAKFAERPDDVLLVFDRKEEEFQGSFYL